NGQGAFVTLIVGFGVGALRIVLELSKDSLDPNGVLYLLGSMNFLTFAAWFFLFCIALIITVSLLTPAPSAEKVANLTLSTISEEEKRNNKASYNWKDVVISVVILAIVISIMVFFNGK